MPSQHQQDPTSSGTPPPAGGPTKPSKLKKPACPKCQRSMTVKQVAPVLFASGLDDVVFGCEDCGTEEKRTVRRT
jgi:RNase P subunit RPR2